MSLYNKAVALLTRNTKIRAERKGVKPSTAWTSKNRVYIIITRHFLTPNELKVSNILEQYYYGCRSVMDRELSIALSRVKEIKA